MDFSAWTLDALQAEFVKLGQQAAEIGTKRNAIYKEIEFRKRQAIAQMRLRGMPTQVRDALKQELNKG